MSARKPKERPALVSVGRAHYISVASGHATDLHAYLRSNGVRCEPPEPYQTDTESINLGRVEDVAAIQALLNRWA